MSELLRVRVAATLILVTHDVDEALFLADSVVTMGARPGAVRDTRKVGLVPARATAATRNSPG